MSVPSHATSAATNLAASRFSKFWNHPAGPKTIFFWSPLAKWCLVIAGLGDLSRPVETLSVSQNFALAATGLIWSRYSVVIIPKNYSLMAVNVFVFGTGMYQLGRIFNYRRNNPDYATLKPSDKPTPSPKA